MLPEKIKFLGHEYRVLEVTANDIEGNNGETWLKKGIIKIDKDLPQSRKESVLLHEILECIDSHFQLEISHPKIQALEECLYAVFNDNNLVNWRSENETV